MKTELKDELLSKFTKVIEENFAKSECEVLTNIVVENKQLKSEVETLQDKLKSAKEESKDYYSKLIESNNKNDELTKRCATLVEETKKVVDELKKQVEINTKLELSYTKESRDQIFKLVETVFKNPSKVREFNSPVVRKCYQSTYNNGYNQYQESGDYVEQHTVKETVKEE